MTDNAVIVGAGVIGLATAYRLARDGLAVTVVDASRGQVGASVHNAGWVTPILAVPVPAPGMIGRAVRWMARRDGPLSVRPSPRPEHVRFMLAMLRHCNARDFRRGLRALVTLNERTVSLFDEYERDGVRFEYHRAGQLLAFSTRAAMREYREATAPMERIGHTAIVRSGDELRDLEPALGPDVLGGMSCSHERHLDPVSLLEGLTDRCRALGVRFLPGRRITGFRFRGSDATEIVTADEEGGVAEVGGDLFVLAAGAHLGALSRKAGCGLPVHPGKGYGIDDTSGSVTLRHAVYLGEAKVAVTPLSDRLRLAGTMEFGSWDASIDPHRLGGIARAAQDFLPNFRAADYLPDLPAAPTPDVWSGLRPMTPDGLPVIGRLPGRDNVLVAGGHGMFGVTLAPATAEVIAAQVRGGRAASVVTVAARPFDPGRFTPRRIRHG